MHEFLLPLCIAGSAATQMQESAQHPSARLSLKSPDAEGKSTNIVFKKVSELPKTGHAAFPRYCNADTNGVVWVTVVWTMYRPSHALEVIRAIGPSRNMGYGGDSVKTQQGRDPSTTHPGTFLFLCHSLHSKDRPRMPRGVSGWSLLPPRSPCHPCWF